MVDRWIESRRRLLALEKEEERLRLSEKLQCFSAAECQALGISLLSLDVDHSETSLFGRTTLTIRRQDHGPLPTHSFRVGDEAVLYSPKLRHSEFADASTCEGVISKVSFKEIQLVTSSSNDSELVPPLRLDMSTSEATSRKLGDVLAQMETPGLSIGTASAGGGGGGYAWPLINTLFYDAPLGTPAIVRIKPLNANLNSSQVDAVEHALGSPHLALIHGPPGTGKTTAVTELILQAVARKQKVLVTAPSNVAVDNLVERLAAFEKAPSSIVRPRIVRLGHPARINPVIQRFCLDAVIFDHETQEIIADIRKEMTDLRTALEKKARGGGGGGRWEERRHIRTELRALSRDVAKREKKIVSDIIRSSDVVLATCVGASSSLLNNVDFDMCVIDEAAQAIDVSCWIPMLRAPKCVMAGDHCQLPPTVMSKEAEQGGLADTLFHRIITNERTSACARLLDTQYRMHGHINQWASVEMYEGKLKSHPANEAHTLYDLTGVSPDDSADAMQSSVVLLIDTSGCGLSEEECEGGSVRNFGEAKLVLQHVARLVASGVPEKEIGVITPYNAQVQLLKLMIRDSPHPHVSVKTVDGFQGGEKEAIILSFVRSNEKHTVGFLADKRRINVAVTRAKRHLAVIADAETCHSDAFLGRLMDYLSEVGEHRSAAELIDDADEQFGLIPNDVSDAARQNTASTSSAINTNATKKTAAAKKSAVPMKPAPNSKASGPSDAAAAIPRHNAEMTEEMKKRIKSDFDKLITAFANGSIEGGVVSIVSANTSDASGAHGPQSRAEVDRLKASGHIISGSLQDNVVVFAVNPIMSNCLQFSSSLNSFQRLLVHEVAEAHLLGHRSEGEGADRYIEVYKKITKEDRKKIAAEAKRASLPASALMDIPEEASTSASSSSESESDDESDGDDDGEEGGAAAVATSKQAPPQSSAPVSQSKKASKQGKASAAKKPPAAADDDDIFALLDSEISKNKELADKNKYRISVKAMPNPEKERVRAGMVRTLADMESARAGPRPTSASTGSASGGRGSGGSAGASGRPASGGGTATRARGVGSLTSTISPAQAAAEALTQAQEQATKSKKKMVLKKPPPNFGGGRLGGGSST